MKQDEFNEAPQQEASNDQPYQPEVDEVTKATPSVAEDAYQQQDTPVDAQAEPYPQPQPITPMAESAPATFAPKKKRKGLIALIVAVGAVVLLGGGAAAAYFLWYQNPDKVLGDAFSSVMTAEKGEFTMNLDAKPIGEAASSDVQGINISANGRIAQDAFAFDGTFGIARAGQGDLKVDSSIVYSDKTAYFKINNLEKVLNILLGAPAGETVLDTPLGPLVKKVDGNWVKVAEGDLKDFDDDIDTAQTCTADLAEKVKQDKAYTKELTDLYKKHKFVVIDKQLGTKEVAGIESLGYVVSLDIDTLADYVRGVGDTKFGKELVKCDDDTNFKKMADDIKDESKEADDMKTEVEVWAARFGHQLTAVNLTGKSDDTELKITTEFFLNKEVNIEAPSSSIPVKEVTDEYEKIMNERRQQAAPLR